MLEVINMRNGSVLSHLDGVETADSLTVEVRGITDTASIVKINGEPAVVRDRIFSGKAVLKEKINEIVITSDNQFGENQLKLTVMWDKNSFRRFSFFIDDNSFFWTEIMKNRPASLFDQFYLKNLKNIHDKYGTKFCLNCFYRNDHDPDKPELKDFPEDYRGEFDANSDWLRLAFHAYSEFPDRPYQHVATEKLAEDYDLLQKEIVRIAGEKAFAAAPVIHWAMTNPKNLYVLKERGVNILTGGYSVSRTSVDVAETSPVSDIGYFYERDVVDYVTEGKIFYDKFTGMMLSNDFCCCNYDDIAALDRRFGRYCDPSSPNYRETLALMTHEQYSFPYYQNYIPNHFERMEYACKLVAEAGYEPVFMDEGLFGNKAWQNL
ncbi:MAG: hypothetical protein IKA65_02855 [Lentisphaeria bacterium]|nr:hypothetical protein [Lentisphaeria bacterium]